MQSIVNALAQARRTSAVAVALAVAASAHRRAATIGAGRTQRLAAGGTQR